MRKFRILEVERVNGNIHFVIQERLWFLFWKEWFDTNQGHFNSMEGAEQRLKFINGLEVKSTKTYNV
jgi:hypothetical protein